MSDEPKTIKVKCRVYNVVPLCPGCNTILQLVDNVTMVCWSKVPCEYQGRTLKVPTFEIEVEVEEVTV